MSKRGLMTAWRRKPGAKGRESGFTLLETMIASFVLLVGVIGVLALFAVAIVSNTKQGDVATRTIEYAQDKMEQLMVLRFNDVLSDTTQTPTCNVSIPQYPSSANCPSTINLPAPSTFTGLGGGAANTSYGGIDPNNLVTGYYDYVDALGNYSTSSAGAQYLRQWRIDNDATPAVKTIYVSVTAMNIFNGKSGIAPRTILVSQRTSFDEKAQ